MDNIIRYSIDRFEENIAICEEIKSGKIININKKDLPNNCKEGDIIKFENGKYWIDKEETEAQKAEVSSMLDSLFKKNN